MNRRDFLLSALATGGIGALAKTGALEVPKQPSIAAPPQQQLYGAQVGNFCDEYANQPDWSIERMTSHWTRTLERITTNRMLVYFAQPDAVGHSLSDVAALATGFSMLEGVFVAATIKPLNTPMGQVLQRLWDPNNEIWGNDLYGEFYLYPGDFSLDSWGHFEIHTAFRTPWVNQAYGPNGRAFVPRFPFSRITQLWNNKGLPWRSIGRP